MDNEQGSSGGVVMNIIIEYLTDCLRMLLSRIVINIMIILVTFFVINGRFD